EVGVVVKEVLPKIGADSSRDDELPVLAATRPDVVIFPQRLSIDGIFVIDSGAGRVTPYRGRSGIEIRVARALGERICGHDPIVELAGDVHGIDTGSEGTQGIFDNNIDLEGECDRDIRIGLVIKEYGRYIGGDARKHELAVPAGTPRTHVSFPFIPESLGQNYKFIVLQVAHGV